MTETITVQLVNSSLDDAPSISGDTRQAARRLIADVLSVTMAGASTAEGQIMLASVADRGPDEPCGVAASSARLASEAAALVNGTMGYSIGLTDTHAPSITHPGPSVVPPPWRSGRPSAPPMNRSWTRSRWASTSWPGWGPR